MTHTEATKHIATMAYRHLENFTTEERLVLLDACSVLMDEPESTKAKEAAAHLRDSIAARTKADCAQGEFIELLKGGR